MDANYLKTICSVCKKYLDVADKSNVQTVEGLSHSKCADLLNLPEVNLGQALEDFKRSILPILEFKEFMQSIFNCLPAMAQDSNLIRLQMVLNSYEKIYPLAKNAPCKCKCKTHGYGCSVGEATCRLDILCERCKVKF